jgi:7-carboxy-7-deazaguanine synthase
MPYRVKEIHYTLQGEGAQTGRPVVLCRFQGCNLDCDFCDTDHEGVDGPGGGEYESPRELAGRISGMWPDDSVRKAVLLTGGEPLLQVDGPLVGEFHSMGFELLLETNGTMPLTRGIDWVCVSPKGGSIPLIRSGDELKLIYPQIGVDPALYLQLDFDHFYLQPMWGDKTEENTSKAMKYCLAHPRWALGVQLHKYLSIP